MRTFGSIMKANRGIGPGFDFIRLALSLSVVGFHSFQLTYGDRWMASHNGAPMIIYVEFIVPAFFALSGFLVSGSMVRLNNVRAFLVSRALRIFPALAAEISLSGLILGPLVTTLPLASYFHDAEFAKYFTNVLGIIRYHLPGVFHDNPISGIVNGQLWTVPSELHCYIALAALMITGMATKRWVMAAAFLAAAVGECFIGLLPGRHYTAGVLQSPESLVICFLCGNVFYLFREKIPVKLSLLAGSILGFVFAYYIPIIALLIGPVSATYCIVFIGLHRIPRVPVLQRGDYSYGIYLYSFPLQQAAIWALPGLREWYWNLLLGGTIAICFAMISWHLLEKRALALRKYLVPKPSVDAASSIAIANPGALRKSESTSA